MDGIVLGDYGDLSVAANATITAGAIGINAGSNVTIDNAGAIASGHKGIIVANDSLIDNSGSISTSGSNAYGIDLSGTGNVLIHSGPISTAGSSAYGIHAAAGTSASYNDITVEAGGKIITAGATAYGIYLGDYAQF